MTPTLEPITLRDDEEVTPVVRALYDSGRSVHEIAAALDITVGDVAELLDLRTWCDACGRECEIIWVDTSFDHAFGVEIRGYAGSRCCEGTVHDERGREVLDVPDDRPEREDY